MLSIGASTKVFLRPGPTDLRLGFEGLYQLVRTKLQQDPLSGHVFAFCNQTKTSRVLKKLNPDGCDSSDPSEATTYCKAASATRCRQFLKGTTPAQRLLE
jgi:hypothetical protein